MTGARIGIKLISGYYSGMDKREKTLQIVANILGNISAISAGIAIYEKCMDAVYITLLFALMAVITSRSA